MAAIAGLWRDVFGMWDVGCGMWDDLKNPDQPCDTQDYGLGGEGEGLWRVVGRKGCRGCLAVWRGCREVIGNVLGVVVLKNFKMGTTR